MCIHLYIYLHLHIYTFFIHFHECEQKRLFGAMLKGTDMGQTALVQILTLPLAVGSLAVIYFCIYNNKMEKMGCTS